MEKKVLTETQVERRNAIKDTLKSMIFPLVLCAIIFVGIFVVVNYQEEEEVEEIVKANAYDGGSDPIVMESDAIKFTLDPTTTQFEVLVKSTGKVWKSNPDGCADDSLALTEEKSRLQSTLVMTYSTEVGLETTYDSYKYSAANGIYEIEQGEDYVRVNYSLGEVQKEFTIPPVCTKADFDKWTKQMSKEGLNLVQQYYKKYDIKKLGKKDNEEELLANYPILADEVIYVLRQNTKDNVKSSIEKYFGEAGYTYEDCVKDKELDMSSASNDKPVFNVDVIYRLDGDDLLVEIPFKELEYKKEYPIYTITPLPYFGAGGTSDEGFLLVPEGGGAIINFNNGKVSQSNYYANVYGWDMALSRDAVVHNTNASFEAYGISNKDDSFICVLEDGKSYASVKADVSGKLNSYNYVNAEYSICQREQYDVGDIASSEIYKYVEELPDESLIQRYRFVDSGSYVDMAKNYGDFLHDKYGKYLELNNDTSVPVAIEVACAVDKKKQILGIPVSRPLALTTYEETQNMIKNLKDDGIDNLSVKLTGWCNGGVSQHLIKDIDTIHALGSKKDLKNLINYANEAGVNIYLNGVTQYEYKSTILDGFFSFRDAAKRISKERAEMFKYSDVTYAAREGWESYFLLHTDLAQQMSDNIVKYSADMGAGVCFEDDGHDLSSDFYKKKPYSRQQVLKLQEDRFKKVNDSGQKIMINSGNDYAIPYSSMVTNMDLRGNDYTILDDCVPFYELAIHGYIDYCGYSLNICGDDLQQLLYSAEYGAGLQFTLMDESSFTLQKTLYTQYYGSDYSAWRERMMSIYNRYNEELGHTFNQEMVNHTNFSDTLSCTEYADGTKVYVNYDYIDAEADGITIPARDYLVVR